MGCWGVLGAEVVVPAEAGTDPEEENVVVVDVAVVVEADDEGALATLKAFFARRTWRSLALAVPMSVKRATSACSCMRGATGRGGPSEGRKNERQLQERKSGRRTPQRLRRQGQLQHLPFMDNAKWTFAIYGRRVRTWPTQQSHVGLTTQTIRNRTCLSAGFSSGHGT